MSDKFFVWKGEEILHSGIVVVQAGNEDEAWTTLLQNDPAAYSYLKTGYSFYLDKNGGYCEEMAPACRRPGFPIAPQTMDTLPPIVQWGR